MKKDIIFSYFAEAIVLISGLLIFKVVLHYFGKDGFSIFALTRRSTSFLLPALLMGLSVGIPRYMAIACSTGNTKRGDTYLISGTSLLILVLFGFSLCLLFAKDTVAFLIFGSSQYSGYILPVVVMLFGYAAYTSIYSYLRGKLAITIASVFKSVNMGILPLVSCIFASSVGQLLIIVGSSMVCFSVFVFIIILRRLSFAREQYIPCTRDLFKYGIQRVPGDFCMAGILALPVFATAHFAGVTQAGYVAFNITILNMLGMTFAPIGLILLPRASDLFARKEYAAIMIYIKRTAILALIIGGSFFIIIEVFTKQVLGLMFASVNEDMIQIARIMMITSLTLPLYVSQRSLLDAFYERPVNTINILKASFILGIFFLPGLFCALSTYYIALVFSLTYALLALLTIRELITINRSAIKHLTAKMSH